MYSLSCCGCIIWPPIGLEPVALELLQQRPACQLEAMAGPCRGTHSASCQAVVTWPATCSAGAGLHGLLSGSRRQELPRLGASTGHRAALWPVGFRAGGHHCRHRGGCAKQLRLDAALLHCTQCPRAVSHALCGCCASCGVCRSLKHVCAVWCRGSFDQRFQSELEFVEKHVLACPHSDSSWNYLRGLMQLPGQQHQLATNRALPRLCRQVHLPVNNAACQMIIHDSSSVSLPRYTAFMMMFESPPGLLTAPAWLCVQVLQGSPSCSLAMALLADVYQEQASVARQAGKPMASSAAASNSADLLAALEVTDPIRYSLWHQQRHMLHAA